MTELNRLNDGRKRFFETVKLKTRTDNRTMTVAATALLTTTQRLVPPGRQERTRRDTKCAEEGLLCLLTREGSAATAAWLRYKGQLSVGFGFKAPRAVCHSWETVK